MNKHMISPNTRRSELPRFSVIIPTLQRSPLLYPLIQQYANHPLVAEILLIKNSPDALDVQHPKLRVLQQQTNIFVNAAWNLGASLAREELLIISNDDIAFESDVLDFCHKKLMSSQVGIIGPSPRSFRRRLWQPYRLSFVGERRHGFGTLMFLKAENYTPIPDELKIWSGDNWLFWHSMHPNYILRGIHIETPMSVSSGSSEFDLIKRSDAEWFNARRESLAAQAPWSAAARREQRVWAIEQRIKRFGKAALSAILSLRSGV